jgi:thiol-disulfide isomerase/thioredoxin
MEKKKLIIGLLAFVIFIGGASLLYSQLSGSFSPDSIVEDESQGQVSEEGEEQEQELQMAPDFTVYDTDGNPVNLSDYFGKPIVLNFWASWCGPCKAEMPDFEEVYKERGEEIQFLMVNCTGGRETEKSAREFIEDSGYTFPVFYDLDLDASMTYGTSSIPVTFFIDPDGHLIAYAQGTTSADVLEQGIGMITE